MGLDLGAMGDTFMIDGGGVQSARIVQIVPLVPGWHLNDDEYNRVLGIALVEVIDEQGRVWSDTFFLGEDLTLVSAPDEIAYRVHFTSPDNKRFATYGGPDWEPRS